MKQRYRLLLRGSRKMFYCVDSTTGKRESLGTSNRVEAQRLVYARNEAAQQQHMNLQLARVYLSHSDALFSTRTWRNVMDEMLGLKKGSTAERFKRAISDEAFDLIRDVPVFRTTAEQLLAVLKKGTVSTNIFLRRIHNYALDLGYLPVAILPKSRWPAIEHEEKRAITKEEHLKIIAREHNPELKAFYELCWHLGGSQTDMASLTADDIDFEDRVIAFDRGKTGVTVIFSFGPEVEKLLKNLPSSGPLFPKLIHYHERHRSQLFKRRCRYLKISGVTLHSYRYAWAERAKQTGYPERFAQQALGHNSKAVHRAYSKKAMVKIPPLEEFEKKVVAMPATPASNVMADKPSAKEESPVASVGP